MIYIHSISNSGKISWRNNAFAGFGRFACWEKSLLDDSQVALEIPIAISVVVPLRNAIACTISNPQ
jgi:hypothetical protein